MLHVLYSGHILTYLLKKGLQGPIYAYIYTTMTTMTCMAETHGANRTHIINEIKWAWFRIFSACVLRMLGATPFAKS